MDELVDKGLWRGEDRINERNKKVGSFGVHISEPCRSYHKYGTPSEEPGFWLCNWCAGIHYKYKEIVVKEQGDMGLRKRIVDVCSSCGCILEIEKEVDENVK